MNARSPQQSPLPGEGLIITVGNVSLLAELYDTPTAAQILKALPLEGRANRWGNEIYFEIPVKIGLESDARAPVEVGELGYWPTGAAFCMFFGPTPVSTDERPRAYSPVNVFGRITGDLTPLRAVPDGTPITVRMGESEP